MVKRHMVLRLAGIGLVIFALAPFAWAVIASLTPGSDIAGGTTLFPRQLTLAHYAALFQIRAFWLPIRNSLVVAGATTALCIAIGPLAAYALARLELPGKRVILGGILAITMFPQIAIVSPLYMVLRELHLIDTYPGLILPYVTFAMPLTVWLLVGFFRQLPRDLENQALVDGASRWQVMLKIVLPLSAPGLATTAILTFIYCWNEFLFALSFTLGPERQTVPVAIALFRGQYQIPWGEILAAAIVATLPVAVVVLAFQRRIVQGLTSGAVKG
jgi:ABC-type glycerol-3-phosphate transport system permease component